MVKLVFKHNWGGEPCGGTSHIPFEYESKEKFLYDLLEETLRAVEKKDLVRIVGNEFYVDCFGFFRETRPGMKNPKIEFEFSEPRVYELEEWFKIHAGKP